MVAAPIGGRPAAAVHLRRRKSLHRAHGRDLDAVLDAATTWIDRRRARQRADRATLGRIAIPSEEEFGDALDEIEISSREAGLLSAYASSGGRALTMAQLAAAVGLNNEESACAELGRLARRVGGAMEMACPLVSRSVEARRWLAILALETRALGTGSTTSPQASAWRLHEPLLRALAKRGYG